MRIEELNLNELLKRIEGATVQGIAGIDNGEIYILKGGKQKLNKLQKNKRDEVLEKIGESGAMLSLKALAEDGLTPSKIECFKCLCEIKEVDKLEGVVVIKVEFLIMVKSVRFTGKDDVFFMSCTLAG